MCKVYQSDNDDRTTMYCIDRSRNGYVQCLSEPPFYVPAALNVNTNANPRGDCQAYVELTELMNDQQNQQGWQETGRWVGYEESYDPEAGGWGPSHISYLTFKSLIQLRRTMNTGVVMLDRVERSLSGIAEKIVDELISKKEIRPSDRDGVLRSLLQNRSYFHRGPPILQECGGIECVTVCHLEYSNLSLDLCTHIINFHLKASQTAVEGQPLVGGAEMQTFSVKERRDATDTVEASMVLVGALDFLERPTVAFVRLKEALVLDSALEAPVPVRFVFILVGPTKSDMDYHETGRAMAALMADKVKMAASLRVPRKLCSFLFFYVLFFTLVPQVILGFITYSRKELLNIRAASTHHQYDQEYDFREADPVFCLSPRTTKWIPAGDPKKRRKRGKRGGLLVRLHRRAHRAPLPSILLANVLSLDNKVLKSFCSPDLEFPTIKSDKVDNMMGVSELLISTCVQGVIFCCIAAQPVLVIGFSGPLLVFEEAFFAFCKSQDIEYIVGRVWVGVWLVVIVVLIVAFEGSFLVRFISRFTQEIFSILISLIFIYETFAKLGRIFKAHPLILNYDHLNNTVEDPWHPVVIHNHLYDNSTGNTTTTVNILDRAYPNTALLSMCLMFGCFFIAFFLRQFKNGTFLPGKIRRLIGDFGVPIAIFLMCVVDINIEDAYTQKLVVPKGLTVSNPAARGWLINPFGEHKTFPVWVMFACCVPACLAFILIFLESQITTLIVSKPERKMVKGSGFHLDLLILVGMGGFGAIFGVPWLSATTVRSVTHANALTVMSKGPKPEIEKVVEQRVSGILVALLVGLSILMEPILKMIPMTALFGIFLYMGITSLNGIQLWDRILLLLVPKKYHPNEPYATRVSTGRMHLYTAIQVVCLAVLWIVKSSPASLALPFVLILTIPLRMAMTGRFFTELEMKCLDADDAKVTFEEEPGQDVYNETQMPL
ncbi:unnamed protein product [Oncorhynchus mykiss]|uniref:Anion exchange protein n=1 Tax=Oncorhynchus mykiss TaxID=8022 RepID=A0A060VQD1_ONCMY|nr:unnamed protein product [Oncorhynchus mykiss]